MQSYNHLIILARSMRFLLPFPECVASLKPGEAALELALDGKSRISPLH